EWKTATSGLRVDATGDRRFRYATYGKAVGGDAHRHVPLFGRLPGLLKGAAHDVVELCVDFGLFPEVLLQALNPFEVRHDDAASVRKHVGQDEHTPVLENRIGHRCDWAVRAFADD